MQFKWNRIKQDYFDKIKRELDRDNLSTYLYFNEEFKIHTDASNFWLGAVISWKRKPIAFCTRKLTGAHKRYTVT